MFFVFNILILRFALQTGNNWTRFSNFGDKKNLTWYHHLVANFILTNMEKIYQKILVHDQSLG